MSVSYNMLNLPKMVDFAAGVVRVGMKEFRFQPLPAKLMEILDAQDLVNWIQNTY